MSKLTSNLRLTNKETNKLVKHMAKQLLEKTPNPGKEGVTYQWCIKLVTHYPQLAEDGPNGYAKTVICKIKIDIIKNRPGNRAGQVKYFSGGRSRVFFGPDYCNRVLC